ncbi:SDR family NAD(P)-dependent oxidoreductase [Christensenella intestinihominis]|uniref:SDR family NAD(P)-dependent oxidoreductase n=1 Tax=Christensenella intestinihominis TaxID=1851429 RepID=UPI00082C4505|nr:SDR family oxidoreductase [Christensenella intestinihominis]
MGKLRGKYIAITGAGSGIGQETARLFAREGARLALVDRNYENVRDLEKELGFAKAYEADVSSEESVKRAFGQMQEWGRLDAGVNCAGIFAEGEVLSTAFPQWKTIMGINLDGVFLCMKYELESMRAAGAGSIINIASEAGLSAIANQVAYNVSKAAVIMLSKSAAVDYAACGIRVNCVCPGRIKTPLVEHVIQTSGDPEKELEKLSGDRPAMRMGTPQEIAYACLAFAADDMAYATGSVLSVDGGYTAR